MLNHADLVEEQELKEQILDRVIRRYENQVLEIRDDDLINAYLIVRMRNNESRREEYNNKCEKLNTLHQPR